MTQRCSHPSMRLRRARPSHHQLQEHSASSHYRATDFTNERVTFDGHICDTSVVVDPTPDTLQRHPRVDSFTRRPFELHYSTRDRLSTTRRSVIDITPWTRHWIHNIRQTSNQQRAARATSCLNATRSSSTAQSLKQFCTHPKPSTNELISTFVKELFLLILIFIFNFNFSFRVLK